MTGSRRRHHDLVPAATLICGYAALIVAVLVAYTHPVRRYEMSIYRATPPLVWVALALAILLALGLAFRPRTGERRWIDYATFVLAYAALLAFVALPLFRGYYFVGSGDALTHLGWTKDIATNRLDPVAFLYPAVHLTGAWIAELGGVSVPHALQLVVLVYFALFLLFVPLCVRAAVGGPRAAFAGLFAAGLFLPINSLHVFRMTHPFSQSVLFFPVVLYLLFLYVNSAAESTLPGGVSRVGVVLSLASAALVLVHPQMGVALVLLLATLTGLQWVYRLRWPRHPIAADRSLHIQALAVGLFYLVWTANKDVATDTVTHVVESLTSGPQVGTTAAQQTGSVAAVGASPLVLALKLFLPSMVLCVLAGGLICLIVRYLLVPGYRSGRTYLAYLSCSLVPLFGLFLVFFLAQMSFQYFRYHAAIMAVVTILGAVAVVGSLKFLSRHLSPRIGSSVAVVALAALLVLSAMTVYFSPYILRGSSQVPEQRVDGYERAFEQRATATPFVGLRSGPERYLDAVYGTRRGEPLNRTVNDGRVPPPVFESNLSTHFDGARYLPITRARLHNEIVMYDGFRYSRAGFRSLRTTPGIDRVQTNGEFRLYRLANRTNRTAP